MHFQTGQKSLSFSVCLPRSNRGLRVGFFLELSFYSILRREEQFNLKDDIKIKLKNQHYFYRMRHGTKKLDQWENSRNHHYPTSSPPTSPSTKNFPAG
jgi:hypothetical protein